jgi:hypothetical protein
MSFRICTINMKERQAGCWTWIYNFFRLT